VLAAIGHRAARDFKRMYCAVGTLFDFTHGSVVAAAMLIASWLRVLFVCHILVSHGHS